MRACQLQQSFGIESLNVVDLPEPPRVRVEDVAAEPIAAQFPELREDRDDDHVEPSERAPAARDRTLPPA